MNKVKPAWISIAKIGKKQTDIFDDHLIGTDPEHELPPTKFLLGAEFTWKVTSSRKNLKNFYQDRRAPPAFMSTFFWLKTLLGEVYLIQDIQLPKIKTPFGRY